MGERKIKWLTTGGTIDSQPYPDPGHPPADATNGLFSHLPLTLKDIRGKIRPDFVIELEQVFGRDSKYINEREIAVVAKHIMRDKKHDVFVVTHGTDTMARNSRLLMKYLESHLRASGKTVIMTGAITPLTNGPQSDGIQNLAYIVEHYDNPALFPPGVHVLMHSQIFSPIGLLKDSDKMKFYVTDIPTELRKDEKEAGLSAGHMAMSV